MNQRDYEMSFRYDPDVASLPDTILEESMQIAETLENRKNGIDVINWEEKAEMDKISQAHGKDRAAGGSFYGESQDEQTSSTKATSDNPKEQELMDSLADVMKGWEELDD